MMIDRDDGAKPWERQAFVLALLIGIPLLLLSYRNEIDRFNKDYLCGERAAILVQDGAATVSINASWTKGGIDVSVSINCPHRPGARVSEDRARRAAMAALEALLDGREDEAQVRAVLNIARALTTN